MTLPITNPGELLQHSCKKLLKELLVSKSLLNRLIDKVFLLIAMVFSQYFNEIMPTIYRRFTEKEPRQWRQIYKVCIVAAEPHFKCNASLFLGSSVVGIPC